VSNIFNYNEVEKVAIALQCDFKTARRRASRSGLISAKFVLHMRRNYYF